MAVYIGSTTTYMRLDSWRMAKIIQLATYKFCQRYFNHRKDPSGKQFSQTTGAARAVPANIAEGSARHQTSIETEMQLLDVARASLSELIDDLMFVLMIDDLPVWEVDDERAIAFQAFRLSRPVYGKSLIHDVTEQIQQDYSAIQPWIESEDVEICVNSILILSLRVMKMLRYLLEKRLETFADNGGFRENMTDTRLQARSRQMKEAGAPRCPDCGAVMVKRMIKAGVKAGREFWGCSQWTKTGCPGKIDI